MRDDVADQDPARRTPAVLAASTNSRSRRLTTWVNTTRERYAPKATPMMTRIVGDVRLRDGQQRDGEQQDREREHDVGMRMRRSAARPPAMPATPPTTIPISAPGCSRRCRPPAIRARRRGGARTRHGRARPCRAGSLAPRGQRLALQRQPLPMLKGRVVGGDERCEDRADAQTDHDDEADHRRPVAREAAQGLPPVATFGSPRRLRTPDCHSRLAHVGAAGSTQVRNSAGPSTNRRSTSRAEAPLGEPRDEWS